MNKHLEGKIVLVMGASRPASARNAMFRRADLSAMSLLELLILLMALVVLAGITLPVFYHIKVSASLSTVDKNQVSEAVAFLKNTERLQWSLNDTVIRTKGADQGHAYIELFKKQSDAIRIIGKSGDPKLTEAIIPYLNYSKDGNLEEMGWYPSLDLPDVRTLRSRWPAFDALMDLKGSDTIVMAYALDTKNPVDDRIACYVAIKYLNPQLFEKARQSIEVEFAKSSPPARSYLKRVRLGKAVFDGVPPFSKWMQDQHDYKIEDPRFDADL